MSGSRTPDGNEVVRLVPKQGNSAPRWAAFQCCRAVNIASSVIYFAKFAKCNEVPVEKVKIV
jgi:hypothetical protein